jgi:hypothetical protein
MEYISMAIILLMRKKTYRGHAPPQPKDVFLLQNMAHNGDHSTWLSWSGPENNM